MSYCRFSSDDFKCDVYVYEDIMGGFTIHVAASKIIGTAPHIPFITEVDNDTFFKAYQNQMKFMETVKREPIGLQYDGQTFSTGSAIECANKLIELKELGYHVPQHAIDSLTEEDKCLKST